MIPLLCSFLLGTALKATASDPCLRVQVTATAMMEARQAEVPAHKVVSLYRKGTQADIFRVYVVMIHDAYQSRLWGKKATKERAVTEFASKYYTMCWKHRV